MQAMARTITLHDANKGFSRVIGEVEAGEEITITRDGEPIGRLVPVRRERVRRDHSGARSRMRSNVSAPLRPGGDWCPPASSRLAVRLLPVAAIEEAGSASGSGRRSRRDNAH